MPDVPLPRLPLERPDLLRPAPLIREFHDRDEVRRVRTVVGDEAWLVTGYAHVRALLDDERLGRSHPEPAKAARAGNAAIFSAPGKNFDRERQEHARTRSFFQSHFTARRMQDLRPRVEQLTGELLDGIERHGPPADLQRDLATPLPIAVISEVLGVPHDDRGKFRAWSEAATNTADRDVSLQGLAELYQYGTWLVERKRKEPGDDVISRLCARPDASDDDVITVLCKLLIGGHETTVVQIGWGALFLLADPGRWAALVRDPSAVPGAVEEMLRAPITVPSGVVRYARTDLEFAGVRIGAGDLVLLDTGAANHDRRVFEDPDGFDVARDVNRHLAFGHGRRHCPGAPLARLELTAVFSRLVARFPSLRLAVPASELKVREHGLTAGLVALPVTW
ncbi:Pentalenolactone synthase [Actinomadura rubteroloni]|uniref:Pentalenolactone synthase n=1 Tax=Actinomadura rubteroloni TaxID=1926885 RepID=A0A2P4UEY2_9ACTN|nr:cytochrome P450 [Actinomadura rubteroloni]POM23613.1 Pentalenolactone synthase [Actinomadura rubteroloni]